jgi:uncharacterized protein (TIRG00374 family)
MSPVLRTLLKILLSGALLFYLLWKAQLHAIFQIIRAADLRYYLLAIAIYIAAQPIRTMRWWLLLKEKQISVAPARLLVLCFIGTFFSGFLPTIVGGDVIRGYYVFKESNAHDVSFASILVERLCGLVIVMITGGVAGLYFLITQGPSPLITICLCGSCLGFVLMCGIFYPPVFRMLSRPLGLLRNWNIAEKIAEIYQAVLSYKGHAAALAWCSALSLAYELVIILIHYLMAQALGWGIPGTLFFLAVPVITIVSMFPLSVGGLGVREGAMVIFFSQYGVSAANAISLSLLSYSVSLIAGALGGMLYPFYSKGSSGQGAEG